MATQCWKQWIEVVRKTRKDDKRLEGQNEFWHKSESRNHIDVTLIQARLLPSLLHFVIPFGCISFHTSVLYRLNVDTLYFANSKTNSGRPVTA